MDVEKDKSSKKKKSRGEKKGVVKELEVSIEKTVEESGEMIMQKGKKEREDPPLRYRETALIDGVITPKDTQKCYTCHPPWSQCTTHIRTHSEKSSAREQTVNTRPLWSETEACILDSTGAFRSVVGRPPTANRFGSDVETLDMNGDYSATESTSNETTVPSDSDYSATESTSKDTTVPSDSSMFPCKDPIPAEPETYYSGKDTVLLKQGEKCYKSLDNRTLLFIREVPNSGHIVQERRVDSSVRVLAMRREGSERVEEEKREQRSEEMKRVQRKKREQRNEEKERQKREIEKNTVERVEKNRREPVNFGFDAAIVIHDWKFPGKKHMLKLSVMCLDFKIGNVYVNDEPVDIERKKRVP